MANLRELRTRIASVRSTRKITSAMKMVAASRLRQAQEAAARTVAASGAELPPGLCEAVQTLLQNGNYVLN